MSMVSFCTYQSQILLFIKNEAAFPPARLVIFQHFEPMQDNQGIFDQNNRNTLNPFLVIESLQSQEGVFPTL